MDVLNFISLMIDADLSKLSYSKIKSSIINNNILFPYTTAIIKKGTPIERGRLNEKDNFFNSEFEISYRTDLGRIIEFGRANEPYHSRFYGTLPSKDIKYTRIVLFSELVNNFVKIPTRDFDCTVTIGRWFATEDFEVADVCFSDDYFNNEEIKDKYEKWLLKLENTEIGQDQYIRLLKYFSDEFAKTNIVTHHDYKLSTIYADYAIYTHKLNGLIYPSVKTEYKGLNIVLTPQAVEKFLNLREVCMFKFQVLNGKATLFPLYYSDDLGSFNSKFVWKSINLENKS